MKKILIVGDNRPGVLSEITDALERVGANIETLTGRTIGDFCVATLTVDKYDDALRALSETHLQAITEDALLIRLPDRPGSLAQIAKRFSDASINVGSIHILRRSGGVSLVALSAASMQEATGLLKDVLVS